MRAAKIAVIDFYTAQELLNINIFCFVELLVCQGVDFWADYIDNEDYSDIYGYDKNGKPVRIPVIEFKGLQILAKQLGLDF